MLCRHLLQGWWDLLPPCLLLSLQPHEPVAQARMHYKRWPPCFLPRRRLLLRYPCPLLRRRRLLAIAPLPPKRWGLGCCRRVSAVLFLLVIHRVGVWDFLCRLANRAPSRFRQGRLDPSLVFPLPTTLHLLRSRRCHTPPDPVSQRCGCLLRGRHR